MVFDSYATYYDLLYKDKRYDDEANYVHRLIETHSNNSKTILDLGCGTGRHASEFADLGYKVTGVDISPKMINIAKKNVVNSNIEFTCDDIRNIRLGKKFNVVVALFHVMSYQTEDEDLLNTLETAAAHLEDDGLLIFDCWYGPAVVNDPPLRKIKKIITDDVQLKRIAKPSVQPEKKIVTVNYKVHVKDEKNVQEKVINENHHMRYLYEEEIKEMAEAKNFKIEAIHEWMSFDEPTSKDGWNVVFVLKKISGLIKKGAASLLVLNKVCPVLFEG